MDADGDGICDNTGEPMPDKKIRITRRVTEHRKRMDRECRKEAPTGEKIKAVQILAVGAAMEAEPVVLEIRAVVVATPVALAVVGAKAAAVKNKEKNHKREVSRQIELARHPL